MRPVTFVKLGGSLITEKDQPFTAREDVITRLAREVADSRTVHEGRIVVGHGSGSFGHVAAARTKLLDPDSEGDPAEALSQTQRAVAALHRRVVSAFREAGSPVFSFAPSSAFVTNDGHPVDVRAEPVQRALELGAIPVTFGDVFLDRKRNASICSTETVFRTLLRILEAQNVTTNRVVWLGDTDGVYDVEGNTIGTLTPDRIDHLLDEVEAPAGTDVTGGMKHRLRTARALARRGVPSLIASGLEAGRLRRVLRGDDGHGTYVHAEEDGTE